MKAALISLHSFLGAEQNELVFYIQPINKNFYLLFFAAG
jgi:hypothetical protein